MDNDFEQAAKEWFYGTPGAFVGDLVAKFSIKKTDAQRLVSKWAAEKRGPVEPKPLSKKAEYWEIAKAHREDIYEEYVASGSKLAWPVWRNQRIRQLRDN